MITETERKYLIDSMTDLLSEYDYDYSLNALNIIIDEWAHEKSGLIEAFKRHPNYVEGKFLIAFDKDYSRDFDVKGIRYFKEWLIDNCIRDMVDTLPEEINDKRIADCCTWLPRRLFDWIDCMYNEITGPILTEEQAAELEEIIPQIHPHKGQKVSRVINKLCVYLNYNKHADYNKEFAKFADALNPLTITRHTILSINPLDYLTMSFGNSWSSCHTIDKNNVRDMPNSYEGRYSSGTISYMLDGSSMVFYTVDKKYDGNDYWTQPKINRQMFHYGQDKLVQGRLYPQDNDDDDEAYTPYRQIVQSIMSVIFNVPNFWSLHKGAGSASEYIESEGTHYRDYECYGNCSLSQIKGSENDYEFVVGAQPICVKCGKRHSVEDNINHCVYVKVCKGCGRLINEDEGQWCNDDFYCSDCVTYCDECWCYEPNDRVTYLSQYGIHVCNDCLEEDYFYCERCGEYHKNSERIWLEEEKKYVCAKCYEEE